MRNNMKKILFLSVFCAAILFSSQARAVESQLLSTHGPDWLSYMGQTGKSKAEILQELLSIAEKAPSGDSSQEQLRLQALGELGRFVNPHDKQLKNRATALLTEKTQALANPKDEEDADVLALTRSLSATNSPEAVALMLDLSEKTQDVTHLLYGVEHLVQSFSEKAPAGGTKDYQPNLYTSLHARGEPEKWIQLQQRVSNFFSKVIHDKKLPLAVREKSKTLLLVSQDFVENYQKHVALNSKSESAAMESALSTVNEAPSAGSNSETQKRNIANVIEEKLGPKWWGILILAVLLIFLTIFFTRRNKKTP